jgi:hypothetical protein
MLMAFALCAGTFAVQNMPLGDMQMITGLQPIFVRQILLGIDFYNLDSSIQSSCYLRFEAYLKSLTYLKD